MNKKKKRGNGGRRKRTAVTMGYSTYQELLNNPCNATPRSYYGGDKGVVQRFVQDVTLNTSVSTLTSGYIVFQPAKNGYLYGGQTASSSTIAPTLFVGPAAPWLAIAASKLRPLAACVQVIPSAVSMTNMTGEIGVAVISQDSITTVGTY